MSEEADGSPTWRESPPHAISVDQAEELDRRCDRFEAAWRGGECPRHEDHLRGDDGPFRAALKAELIAIELEWRRRQCKVPVERLTQPDVPSDVDDYLTRVPSVLETIAAVSGPVRRVLLRDTDSGDEPPVHHPRGGDDSSSGTRYRIDGEIAQGGMGAVLKGRDPDLGRDVALKVLREDLRENAEMVRRFVEEAQIGGQLQHPGIVPIYEMGTFGDHRPFFSMKLVKGDTLAKLLSSRRNPGDGLSRFLSIFESIAQTVAYSHARGVIHRDLKPSNVMVGAFGEVQVMDWGLAKVLPRGGVVDDAVAGKVAKEETVIATARSGSDDSDLSRAGSVMGTPSYMAPEQARGEIDRLDERADVFALGSILCEILTGQPAFLGRHGGEIQRKAAVGDLAEALARLDSCGADLELLALAKECLAREPEDRPRTAGAVAERIGSHLSGVQERLRRAELKSVEERGRRLLTTAVASAVVLLLLTVGGGYTWNERQKAERLAKTTRGVDDALADAAKLRGEALAAPPGDTGRWSAAVSAAKRAEGLLVQGDADASLKGRVVALIAGLEQERAAAAEKARQIEVDRVLLDDLESVRGNLVMHRDFKRADAEYADAFRKAGVDVDAVGAEKAGRWLSSRSEPVELAGYLDQWAFLRRQSSRPEADWSRLVGAARRGDPDAWRDGLRTKFGRYDAETVAEFRKIADDRKLEDQPPAGLLLLARQLKYGCDDGPRAAQVLRRGARRYPGDFRIHFELALGPQTTLESGLGTGDIGPDREEAVRHLLAALAIRPTSISAHVVLNFALLASRELEEAEALCREAVRIKPGDSVAHGCLANSLRWQGKHDEATREIHEAIRLDPTDAGAHAQLGLVLRDQLKFDESIPEFREAIRLRPDYFGVYLEWAQALRRKTDYSGALAVIRKAQGMTTRSLVDLYHPPEWFAKIEALAALSERLPAILRGDDRPKDNVERVELGQMCSDKKLNAAALRFRSQALDEDPKLGESRRLQLRYNTACSALLVASGQGEDATPLDEATKSGLRRRALGWLRAESTAWSVIFNTGNPQDRETALSTIRWWSRDIDLATVRDAALEKLPELERKDWRTFWDEYEDLMRKGSKVVPR